MLSDEEYCDAPTPVRPGYTRTCPYKNVLEYNQVVFYNGQGEVLHAYQLDEGWSYLPVTSSVMGFPREIGLRYAREAKVARAEVVAYNWKKALEGDGYYYAEENHGYHIDLITGEFFDSYYNPINPDTDPDRIIDYTKLER